MSKKEEAQAPHRGRFQAQGEYLEDSEKWAQEQPIGLTAGTALLHTLRDRLAPADRRVREKQFVRCELFVRHLHGTGGFTISQQPFKKSFVAYGEERVDLEIHAGTAFKDQ